jgi:hypothetical protein
MSRTCLFSSAAKTAVALLAFVFSLGTGFSPPVQASIPSGAPTFSDPTDFENDFFPFEEGAVRVFAGKSEGTPTLAIDFFLDETRDFAYGGGIVTCRVLRETNFEDGEIVEITDNYFAEADDGSVYYFGEVVDDYEDGEIVGHEGGWLVGGPGPDDPEETATVFEPALFMPGEPEVGDVWMPENVPDGPQETDEIVATDRKVKVPAGRFGDCLRILEHSMPDDEYETKWYAPGVGVIKGRTDGERFELIATTLDADD